MSNLKKIKKILKREKSWKIYKTIFWHKQMRFLYSDIALYFNKNLDIKKIAKVESSLTKVKKGPDMFVKSFNSLSSISSDEIKWDSFAKFLWFQYQTSTYWKDVKRKKENIFNQQNYIEKNAEKRVYWQEWISSIDSNNKELNNIITFVLKKVS